MQYGWLQCFGCNIKREFLPLKEFRSTQCFNSQICVWSAVNCFLKAGLTMLTNSVDIISSVSGFIFANFSWRNIRSFMDEEWIDRLSSAYMKIILPSNKKMTPLAAYYGLNESRLSGVIYIPDSIRKLKVSLRRVFIEQPLLRQTVRPLTNNGKDIL